MLVVAESPTRGVIASELYGSQEPAAFANLREARV
jgi:hypothetical protein